MGAAGATHKAYRGDFKKAEQVTPPTNGSTTPETDTLGNDIPVKDVANTETTTPNPYVMSPDVAKSWGDIVTGEATNTPSAATKSVAVDQEVAPPGTIVRAGEHDFVIDSHGLDGATGRRIFNTTEGGLQGELSEDGNPYTMPL